jgi:hypothetical protein
VATSLLAYSIFFLEGIGYLFPWNACITAAAYFKGRFCGTSFQSSFENYFSVGYNIMLVLALPIVLKYGDKYSWAIKIIGPLLGYFFVVSSILLLVFVDVDPTVLFYFTIVQMSVLGLCAAVLSDGLFGFAALFPSQYIGSAVSGIAAAGFAAAIANILTSMSTAGKSTCDASMMDMDALGDASYVPHIHMQDSLNAQTQIQSIHSDLYTKSDPHNTLHNHIYSSDSFTENSDQCDSFFVHTDAVAYFSLTVILIVVCIGGYLLLETLPITQSINDHYERQFIRSASYAARNGKVRIRYAIMYVCMYACMYVWMDG